ncbi:MAG: transglutaminase domain-containing protein [Methanobrevibacter sp.]|nr:transglutaminase domain-containing protein [Methanobrevibacter sp.]
MLIAIACVFLISISASYASDVDLDTRPTKLSQDDISDAAVSVDKYITKNRKLPNFVTISDYNFSMPEYMYLLARTVENKYEKDNSQIIVKYNVRNPSRPTGDNIKGKISVVDCQDYVSRVANFISNEGHAPNYVRTPLGNMQYQQAIYSFIKILGETKDDTPPKSLSLNFNKNNQINKHIPRFSRPGTSTESIDVDIKLNNLSGTDGLLKLQRYMNRNLNHRSGGSHTAAGVERTRTGDCWGLAEWAAKQLKANGYDVRIVQGRSSAASNHRWVQAKIGDSWVNFESSLVTKRYGSKHYTTTCAKVSRIVKYL